jgi:TPR repeat protein
MMTNKHFQLHGFNQIIRQLKTLSRALLVLGFCVFGFAMLITPAHANTFDQGWAAYDAKDYPKAFKILLPLAEKGDTRAQVTIGVMYENGEGIPKDTAKAFEWYEKAANLGVPRVQYELGGKYAHGVNAQQDYAKALHWYRKAADQGFGDAQFQVGSMHALGEGVQVNYNEAAKWFQRAADQGHPRARYSLGLLLENGPGVKQNLTEAKLWYRLAAKDGIKEAAARLAKLEGRVDQTNPPAAAKTPATPQDAPSSSSLPNSAAGMKGMDWLKAQNPEHYTLQVFNVSNEQTMLDFLKEKNLGSAITYIERNENGKTLYTAFYGAYPTRDAALKARAGLPASLQKNEPWPRKFAELKP